MTNSPVVQVSIFGTEYRIASDASPDHTRAVARYVDAKMHEVAGTVSLRSVKRLAVLTAVNLADELIRERRSDRDLETSARTTASRLAEAVDGAGIARKPGASR